MGANRTDSNPALAARIVAYMLAKGYTVATGPGEYNIVYLEGCNADGTPNRDEMDAWNDRRIVITSDYARECYVIAHNAAATTEPGRYYTRNPMNRKGVARIAFGQYTAWRPGTHKGQPALVQVAPVPVHRDMNQNGIRDAADRIDHGIFGINQHGTRAGFKGRTIGQHSAGCAVGQIYDEHLQFIELVNRDSRLLADVKHFVITATFINGDDLYRFDTTLRS